MEEITVTTGPPVNVSATELMTSPPPHTTVLRVVTTANPMMTDPALTGVIIGLVLLTVAVLGFLLYRYLCHNKGAYRTTGEPAPGEDPDDYHKEQTPHKKEYFI